MPKQPIKLICFRHIVIIFQHGEQQAFAKPTWAQEQKLFAKVFNHTNMVSTINIKIVVGDELIKIAYSVRKFEHLMAPNSLSQNSIKNLIIILSPIGTRNRKFCSFGIHDCCQNAQMQVTKIMRESTRVIRIIMYKNQSCLLYSYCHRSAGTSAI
jgi:hypothetical protein